jgi:Prenylcysteine lyase
MLPLRQPTCKCMCRFVFNQSTWTAVNLWRMYMRYGTAPLRFQGRPGHMFSKHFLRIYDLQRNGTAFQTPGALLRRVGLFGLTQRSMRQDLAVRALPCTVFASQPGVADTVHHSQRMRTCLQLWHM